MTLLGALDRYRAGGFPTGYPRPLRVFYAPLDDLHGALLAVLRSATRTVQAAMYAIGDRELADTLRDLCNNPTIDVEITLDGSQASGPYELGLLAAEQYPATSIAVGASEHGSLTHLKDVVVDGRYVLTGTTNWAVSGEWVHDNALTVVDSPALAAEAGARLSAIHAHILAGQVPPPGPLPSLEGA